jgi:hypothetical protein
MGFFSNIGNAFTKFGQKAGADLTRFGGKVANVANQAVGAIHDIAPTVGRVAGQVADVANKAAPILSLVHPALGGLARGVGLAATGVNRLAGSAEAGATAAEKLVSGIKSGDASVAGSGIADLKGAVNRPFMKRV